MYLKSLHVDNFRNLSGISLALSPRLNFFYGDNGVGKTALLEAAFMLARGRSFRTTKVASVIQHAASGLLLRAQLGGDIQQTSTPERTIAMSKERSGQTTLLIDGEKERRVSETARLLPIQVLLPNAGDLILGGPVERRSFIDWGLFHVEPPFLEVSRRYRRVVNQRNAWLKTADESVPLSADPWFEQLCSLSLAMGGSRQRYLDGFSSVFRECLSGLAPELDITLGLEWGGLDSAPEVVKKLSESFPRDVKFGLTHRGPHRADLLFLIGGKAAAETVSRGQAKLIASAALLAQAQYLYLEREQKSIFLIDDFGAELDADHWRQFTQTLVSLGCQILATSTVPLDVSELTESAEIRMFHVEQGQIQAVKPD